MGPKFRAFFVAVVVVVVVVVVVDVDVNVKHYMRTLYWKTKARDLAS